MTISFLAFMRIFLQFTGIILLATLAHEVWHASFGIVQDIGLQFGHTGGAYVQGYNLGGELGAYSITVTVLVFGTLLIIAANKSR